MTLTRRNRLRPLPLGTLLRRPRDLIQRVAFLRDATFANFAPPLLSADATHQVFLGAEEYNGRPFNTLDAVFQLYRVVCDDLRDWPPSTRELAAKALTDIARAITEGD